MSLPSENTSIRMRVWRAVKASGAVVLRDGVYLLPELEHCRTALDAIATDVFSAGGHANILRVEALNDCDFPALFDRQPAYAALLLEIEQVGNALLLSNDGQQVLKQLRKLRKSFMQIVEIDFFPNQAQNQAETSLSDMEVRANRILSPNEPQAVNTEIPRLSVSHYQGRVWATRKRPWVDRLASAWLIRRFIDAKAGFVWLDSSNELPKEAIGFDFDGADFTHTANKVTFEVLLASFSLEQAALKRLGTLVHFLDVGGIQPAETLGIEMVLTGLRNTITDDDQLLTLASAVFDSLLDVYQQAVHSE